MDSSDRLPRHLLIGFVLALFIYVVFFSCDQYVRHRKGAWQVVFRTNDAGGPEIDITQTALNIRTTISFMGEKAAKQGTVVFDRPGKSIPFGTVKFEDLTYLPGSVAFDFFGHEIELLPRTLYLNKKDHPLKADEAIALTANEKLPPGSSYEPRRRKRP